MGLVETIVSLEKQANEIVANARAEAKAIEKSVIEETEAYRQRLAEEISKEISDFQVEMEEKYQGAVAETEKDLTRRLSAIDQIDSEVLKEQIEKIVARFTEL